MAEVAGTRRSTRSLVVGSPLQIFDLGPVSVEHVPRSAPIPDWVAARRRAIGEQIRAARLHANLTQEAVALAVPMDRAAYNRIEQGHASAGLDTLLLIAHAIGVPLADLVR
jgi:DNA-binding XRE family transcriptional regulator